MPLLVPVVGLLQSERGLVTNATTVERLLAVDDPEDEDDILLEPRPTKPIEVKLDGLKDLEWALEPDEMDF